MTFFLCVAGLVWFSWYRAKLRGVPWFSYGNQPDMRRDRTMAKRRQTMRLRTESIKPKSPWLLSTAGAPASFPDLDALTRNPETSARLVADIKMRNPEKSLGWCAEKAIYDIERDRMAR